MQGLYIFLVKLYLSYTLSQHTHEIFNLLNQKEQIAAQQELISNKINPFPLIMKKIYYIIKNFDIKNIDI